MALHITAVDHTLVANHVCSREAVLGSNPTIPKLLAQVFYSTPAIFELCPSIGTSYTVHYVVFWYQQCKLFLGTDESVNWGIEAFFEAISREVEPFFIGLSSLIH